MGLIHICEHKKEMDREGEREKKKGERIREREKY